MYLYSEKNLTQINIDWKRCDLKMEDHHTERKIMSYLIKQIIITQYLVYLWGCRDK